MTPNQTRNAAVSAAQFCLGGLVLGLVTLGFFRLHADLGSTAFADLIVILLFSLIGSFAAAVVLCFLSVASLAYFFAPPALSVAIDLSQHVVTMAAFCVTGVMVAWLIGNARQEKKMALEAEANLRRSQGELRDSEREWREVFEHNPVMYFMIDAGGTVLNVNTFGAAQLGYTVAELVGQSVLDVFLSEDHAFVNNCIAVCLESIGQSHTWEIRKIRKDGSLLWVRENAKAMRRANDELVVLVACEDVTERKRTEDALQQSEAYLAHAQELSHTGSFGWRVAAGEIIWTPETFRIFEYDPATQPTLQLVIERTHPEDRTAVQSTLDQASRDQSDFEHEYRLLMPDGSVKYVHTLARATINAAGSLEFVGALTDITAAKRAERQLRRSEAYLEEAQHLSHTGSWSWDVRRRDFVYRSAEVYRLFGFDPEQGASVEQIQSRIPAEDRQMLGEVVRRAVQAKQGDFKFDFRVALPDGAISYVHSVAHPVLDSDGEVSEIIGTHMDMTEQYAARERLEKVVLALRESEQRFRDYAETASDWLWETGPDHLFTYISERLNAFGIDPAGLIGKRRLDAATDKEAEPRKWREHMATLERHEPFRNFEYTCGGSAGNQRHVSVNGRPVFATDGRFMGYRGTGTDITNQHEAEERLRQSQKMDAIGQLTGGIAHDLNNVLTVITGTIEILQEGIAEEPQLASIAQLIGDAATRGAEITSQLLTFARRQPLEPREIDVNRMVTDTAKLLKPILGEHIDIESDLADDTWFAMADPSQLSAAIVNLAVNARDAMPGGGKLKLATANVWRADLDASRESDVKSGEFVMITVTDTGHGIPTDILDRVFEPFFTTKGVGRGTGLGLSMVYGFAKQSGGTVEIDSEEGRGTVIKLYLPRSAGRAVMTAEPVHATGVPHGHETILVVEDDALVRGYVIAQLGGLGYRTLVASDGAAALALVDQGVEFDLLFTDMIMPGGMNGRELADAITKRRGDVKALYTSGYADSSIVHDGYLDPGVVLLRKPYRKSELAQKIREVLGSGSMS
ncbi:Nodulation protein V [Bradyrhizobium sp. STM 3843]|nr:Nodulation protein V [Bradyrhizobium sp. STM 3843]